MALLLGAGLAVALASGLVEAVVRWVRLARAAAVPPGHTREVRRGHGCEPPLGVGVIGPAAIIGAPAVVTLVAGSRTHTATATASATGNAGCVIEILSASVPRGLYQLRGMNIRLTDLLSLFAVVLEYRDLAEDTRYTPLLRVLPEAFAVAESPVEGVSRSRSEELIEARPYHPGDDTRRINWKAYAHSEMLFVRIGEENPPPSAAAEILIDTRGLDTNSHLDQLISVAFGVAENLERRTHAITVVAQVDDRGPLLLGTIHEARRALAAADPVYGFLIDPVPAGPHRVHPDGDHMLVVTTGRSPASPSEFDWEILVWDQEHGQGVSRERTIAVLD
mgnify:CR=1 FL=1